MRGRAPCNKKCCDKNSEDFLRHQRKVLGKTVMEIASMVGRSHTHIKMRLRELDIHKPKSLIHKTSQGGRKRDNLIWHIPLPLLLELSVEALAERYGLSEGQVKTVRRKRKEEEEHEEN